MSQRILTLTRYLIYRLVTSLNGVFYLALTIAFYSFAFRTRTPEPDYFILVLGLFGGLASFFIALTVSSRANEVKSAPFFVRLESRVEYLVAVFLASFVLGLLLQIVLMCVVLLFNEPMLTFGQALDIPPIWLSINILVILLAMHASDFVARGWSRVWIFGGIAFLLILGEYYDWFVGRIAEMMRNVAQSLSNPNTTQDLHGAANWLDGLENNWADLLSSMVSWPFEATIEAVLQGHFTAGQAFGPAVMLIYATALFLIAADLFASKDLYLLED